MNHSPSSPDEPGLFDLPLQVGPTEGPPAEPEAPSEESQRSSRRAARRAAPRATLPLFQGGEPEPGDAPTTPFPLEALGPAPPPEPDEWPRLAHGARTARAAEARATGVAAAIEPGAGAGLVARFKAAAADLVVFAAVAALLLVGTLRLGVGLRWTDWPAYAAFLVAFSFLYSVISLAFWGQTPGMVWAGIVARGEDAEPLAFGQTARRWIGGLLTMALGGLPGLLALSGRSFADRLSGSRTLTLDAPAG